MPNHYDVFLSYASADNTTLAEKYAGQTGWVMCFKVALQQALDRELGRKGSAEWFLDAQELRTGDNLTDKIKAALDQTRIFVALASTAYFNDQSWCIMERKQFIGGLGAEPSRSRRVFAVLLDEDMRSKWEANVFAGVLDFPFYDKNEAIQLSTRLGEGKISPEFIQRIGVLAKSIAVRIKELEQENNPPAVVPPAAELRGTVCVAAVPGEMEESRTELAEFLRSEGWNVLPERNECDADTEKCRTATFAACHDSVAFVQLLGRFPWRPAEFDRVQFEAAMASGMVSYQQALESEKKPFFRYRNNDFDVNKIPDERHRKWLVDYDVAARSMPVIKKEIGESLKALLSRAARRECVEKFDADPATKCFITLSTSCHERVSLGRQIALRLKQEGVFAFAPDDPVPRLEECFQKEDGLMVVFGNEIYSTRMEPVLLRWRELILGRRAKRTPPMAIYFAEPPPENKEEAINVYLSDDDMRKISAGDNQGLLEFVEAVRSYTLERNGG